MCWDTLLVAGSHFGLSPGWHSMRPSRKGLESEEVDVSCWVALHQAGATAPEHLGWAGPSPHSGSIWKCHLIWAGQLWLGRQAGPEAEEGLQRAPPPHTPHPSQTLRVQELLCPQVAFSCVFQEKREREDTLVILLSPVPGCRVLAALC